MNMGDARILGKTPQIANGPDLDKIRRWLMEYSCATTWAEYSSNQKIAWRDLFPLIDTGRLTITRYGSGDIHGALDGEPVFLRPPPDVGRAGLHRSLRRAAPLLATADGAGAVLTLHHR